MSGTFIDRCLAGDVPPGSYESAIDDEIDAWHSGDGGVLAIHEYLGMRWAEYAAWVKLRKTVAEIVRERKDGGSATDEARRAIQARHALDRYADGSRGWDAVLADLRVLGFGGDCVSEADQWVKGLMSKGGRDDRR